MNKKLILPIALVVATSVFISGCKKFVHQDIKAASNSSVAISTFNDVFEQLNSAVSYEVALSGMTNPSWNLHGTICADVTLSPLGTTFPKTLTIDYGTGCIGSDGVSRSGKIMAIFSGDFRSENTTVNISFENFTNGQYTVTGTDSVTNTGTDANGNPIFSEVIRDVTISWNTQEILWHADLNRTWLEGDTTNFTTDTIGGTLGLAGLNDDVFTLSGTAIGNDSNTHPFSLEVTQPLVLPTSCKWITEGMLIVSPVNFNAGTVDYGTGDCDKQVTIEVDGEVFNFTL
ncbi:MAG: hypothetical protein H6601_09870 [Flavobacteriales bacterium]|nr:hypothetical protein [Flavobacteriales bacterium]